MVVNQFDDNEFVYAAELNALANAHGSGGIISGCSISKGTGDWDIDVTSGSIIESNTEASISSGTVTITDSSGLTSGQSRVTLIHADTGDALASTDGTGASDPASPDIPSGEVLLGFVVVSDTDSTVADSDIIDIPALSQNNYVLDHNQIASPTVYTLDLAASGSWQTIFSKSAGSEVTVYHATAYGGNGATGIRVTWDDGTTTTFGSTAGTDARGRDNNSDEFSVISLGLLLNVRKLEAQTALDSLGAEASASG